MLTIETALTNEGFPEPYKIISAFYWEVIVLVIREGGMF